MGGPGAHRSGKMEKRVWGVQRGNLAPSSDSLHTPVLKHHLPPGLGERTKPFETSAMLYIQALCEVSQLQDHSWMELSVPSSSLSPHRLGAFGATQEFIWLPFLGNRIHLE